MSEYNYLNPLQEQLKKWLADYPFQKKIVFVHDVQAGQNLLNSLASAGVPHLNLTAITPLTFAESLGKKWGLAKPIDADHAWFAFASQLPKMPTGELTVSVADQLKKGNLTHELFTAMSRFRLAGGKINQLQASSNVFKSVIAIWDKYLMDQKVHDRSSWLQQLIKLAKPVIGGTQFAIIDNTPISGLLEQFMLAVLPANGMLFLTAPTELRPANSRDEDDFLASSAFKHWESFEVSFPPAEPTKLIETVGHLTGLRGSLQRVLAGNESLDQYEIVFTSPAGVLQAFGLNNADTPMTFGGGYPVWLTRPGQALISFYDWIAAGSKINDLAPLFRAGIISTEGVKNDAAIDSVVIASLLDQLRVPVYPNNYEAALKAVNPNKSGLPVYEQVNSVLKVLVDLVPRKRQVSAADLSNIGVLFLDIFVRNRTSADDKKIASLRQRLKGFEECNSKGQTTIWAKRFAEILRQHNIDVSPSKPGLLHIADIARAGWTGRRNTIIIGLDEESFPGAVRDSVFLSDQICRDIGLKIPLSSDKMSEKRRQLNKLLRMSDKRRWFVTASWNVIKGEAVFPAGVFVSADSKLPREKWDIFGNVYPTSDHEVISTSRQKKVGLTESQHLMQTGEDFTIYEGLISGLNAERKRQSESLTAFDGKLNGNYPALKESLKGILSASKLETLVACPYRYFLKHILDIPSGRLENNDESWLNALENGNLLHAIFERFMEEKAGHEKFADQKVTLEDLPLITQITDQLLAEWKAMVPPAYQGEAEMHRHQLLAASQIFLTVESARKGVTPVGFEISFGFDRTGANHPPVTIRIGNRDLTLQGRIDRIDKYESGDWIIRDYKSGKSAYYPEADLISAGKLQWILYTLAYNKLLEQENRDGNGNQIGKVIESTYFFANPGGLGVEISGAIPSTESLSDQLEPALALIESGGFFKVQKGKSSPCDFCDYALICEGEARKDKDLGTLLKDASDLDAQLENLQKWVTT